jgi:hypothetical protein
MHAFFFCAHGAGGAPNSMVESARWVEPRCSVVGLGSRYTCHIYTYIYIYIYILYLYITPECIQYKECTQAEPTRQEHLVRANRPTQAEPTLRLRPSRTLPTKCYNFRTRPAVASSYIEVAITSDQQLQSYFFNKISQSYSVLAITSEQLSSCIHTMLQFSNQTSSCI